ncbi:cholesterol transporter ABCA5-like isoform X2 [Babylonia areolata]|uniref:cholesterol transporter ABCA5-like isoform X2 n=1 Tax=Babylonia areolata TaxID=304850 RepID=UPI003FD0BC50
MASFLTQLRGLLWRNFLIKRRQWKLSALEVLVPVLMVVLMILISLGTHSQLTPAVPLFPPHNFSFTAFPPPSSPSKPILAAPDLSFTADVMVDVIRLLNVTSNAVFRDDLTSEAFNEEFRKDPSAADVGVELLWKNTSRGLSVDGYVLRVPFEMVKDVVPGCFPRENIGRCGRQADGLSTECPGNQALTSGLLSLQWAVETALIRTFKDPGFEPPALQIQMMPVPAFRPGATNTQLLVCVFMVIALAPLAYFVTVTIVTEQQSGARVVLKVMGIREIVFWLSWWITYTVTVVLVSVLVTVLLALAGYMGSGGLGLVWLLLLLYGASLLTFSFLLAVFFTHPQVGGAVSGVLTVLLGLLYLAVSLTRPNTPLSLPPEPPSPPSSSPPPSMTTSSVPFPAQVILSLCSPVALALGLDQAIYDHEQKVDSHITSGEFSVVAAVLMLVLDTVLYGCLAVYLHVVLPNQYRLPRKPWFCVTPSYWRDRAEDRENDVIPCDVPEGPHIEPLSEGQSEVRAIRIRDISKKFEKGKKEPVYGLNGLDLDIYEGQVTCVLGHPGAGKTTLMNILAGVMQPISGVAYVYDLNACNVHDHKELAKTVSYCPQSDVIPDDVTVDEHVRMAAFLNGMEVEGQEDVIGSCLSDLQLDSVRQTRAGELTAAQRRRLSVAVALLADTKVLLLDEPTLGMEGEARRQLWELLHARKEMRVVVCTSRYMEEAQYFADRTVVLSRGRLRCVGSCQFLKEQFNVSYLLNVTVKEGSSSDRLLRAVKSHIRGASLVRSGGTTVTLMLPLSQAARLSGLVKMLESRERGSEYLGVTEFSLNLTSLEQVFWKMDMVEMEKVGKPRPSSSSQEEEAGHVFISPLLTPPSDDSLASHDDARAGEATTNPYHHHHHHLQHSASRDSLLLTPGVTPSQLDDLSRRFSAFPAARQLGLDTTDSAGESRRKSAHPRIQGRGDGHPHGEDGNSISRRLSSLFLHKSTPTPQDKRRHLSADHPTSQPPSPSPSSSGITGIPRRATVFADALLKRRGRGEGAGGGPPPLKKSQTSHTLIVPDADRQDKVPFTGGTILPTSFAERRATVAAFQEFRRSMSLQSNLSGLNSLSEQQPTTPPDPLARLHVLDSYDRSHPPSLTSSSRASVVSEENSFSEDVAGRDAESATPQSQHPARIGEVLANLAPLRTGVGLGLQRLGAVVRLRVWLWGQALGWAFLRVLLPVLLAGVGVGLGHASQHLNPAPPQSSGSHFPGKRIHLFGIQHLTYRNLTGESITDLEAEFSRTLDGPERMTHLPSDSWDPGLALESVLDVLRADGSSYRLNYNSSCALALPHTTSFLAHLMRHSPTPTPLHPGNHAYLGPQLSAWLQAWPPRSAPRSERPWDWVPILLLGLALMLPTPMHCAVTLVREREAKLRSYLAVMGVSGPTYYGASFLIHVIEMAVAASFVIIICAASDLPMLEAEGAVESVALLLMLSVPVSIFTACLFSFAFSSPRSCAFLLPSLLLLVTAGLFCLVHFLDRGDTEDLSTVLHYVAAVLWPPYLRFGALHFIARTGSLGDASGDISPFQSHISICYIMLLVHILLLPCLVLLLDSLTLRPPTPPCCGHGGKKKPSLVSHAHSDDEGVTSEVQHVQDLHKNTNKDEWPWLVLTAVSKVLKAAAGSAGVARGRVVKAVDNVTLAVPSGQQLALLGPPGAGKSSLIHLVLGLTPPTEGSIHVAGERVEAGERWKRAVGGGQTGYCPQYNPLWEPLTVDQHVHLAAALTGLQRHDMHSFRDSLYYDLDLDSYRSQRITRLSACEKRKLSFAMSMLGQQSFMILDEPSAGMDPRSRRMYWDAVKHFVQSSGRSGLVSTHSVEEAKALCSRVALMVNGHIRNIGTVEELQQRCRQTFSLEVKFGGRGQEGEGRGQQRMDMLLLFLREVFPSLSLLECFRGRVLFLVTCRAPDFCLSATLDMLESIKRNLDLEELTFSQCSLDQLFLDLTRQQKHGPGRYLHPDDLTTKAAAHATTHHPPHTPQQHPPLHTSPTPPSAGGVASTADHAHPPREVKDEGGASAGQGDVSSDADAAVGMVVLQHPSGDDGGGGVACGDAEEEGDGRGVGAAAPVVFSVDGEDNLAFSLEEGGDGAPPDTQTSV